MDSTLASILPLFWYEGYTEFHDMPLMVLSSVNDNISQNYYASSKGFLMTLILMF